MKYTETKLQGVFIIEPKIFGDERGYFCETFKLNEFHNNVDMNTEFIQDNQSYSAYGIFRGLHFQSGSYSQAKLVRCVKGKVVDIAVDLRKDSPTYKQWVAVELSEFNHKQLFIPKGFAHGFIVISEDAIFQYKVDNVYSPTHEETLSYSDPDINLTELFDDLGITEKIIVSEKDKNGKTFKELENSGLTF